MKLSFLLYFFICSAIMAESFFTRQPALSPEGNQIVFAYHGDLWKVSASGGVALRITAMTGEESNPVFSPDGNYIAFTGYEEGNGNVYILNNNNGEIKQLTFNDATDKVETWSWDSKEIYFSSNRENNLSAYKVSINGGTPKRIFKHYFNNPHNLALSPTENKIYFNESWESSRFYNRKRYKGDFNPDIKSFNFETKEYKKLTNYNGKDLWTSVDKMGNLYFASDEGFDEYNLFTFVNGKKTALTNFSTAIFFPKVNASGTKVVFEKDYQTFIYDVKTKTTSKVDIVIPDYNKLSLNRSMNVSDNISNFDVSPDNKKITFVSSGKLFVSDVKGKFVEQIQTKSDERVLEVLWLNDNETILYTRTIKGWKNIFTVNVNERKEKQLTFDEQNNSELVMNNDKTKLLYFSGRNQLRMMELKSFNSETLVEDEFWAIYNTSAYFSPDEKYVLYTAYRNFEQDIIVYSFEKKKSFHITKTGVTETSPFWSPDGKYIYFATDRLNPGYPRGTKNTDIYRIALKKYDKPFKSDEFGKLFAEEKKDSNKINVEIDFDGLNDRWESVASFPGNQYGPVVIKNKEKTEVLFSSNHDNSGYGVWKKTFQDFEKVKTKKIKGLSGGSLFIRSVKGKNYILSGGKIYTLNLNSSKAEKINIGFKFEKNFNDEFKQIFYEAWADMQENFYDENFHGIDWEKMRERYSQYLPYIYSRSDLRHLLNDMLGELNSSHQGFYSSGKEERGFYRTISFNTGILFNNNRPYEVDRIVKNSPADKADIMLKKGDILVKVNDKEVIPTENREKYFTSSFMKDEYKLTFRRGDKEFDIKIHPEIRAKLSSELYDEWIDWNQKLVDKKTDKKVAYIHMKDMGEGSLKGFLTEMANEALYRDGLILDLRYNRGGNVHDEVLRFLSQKPYLQWKYREGKLSPQPNFAPSGKPIVLLINEQSLSDAEMFSAGFRALNLGTIIGTESYRWIIFTSGKAFVDGSYIRMPSWGCYTLDGKDLELTGIKPDIYIKNTFKDRLENKDPQLEKAIEFILNKI